MFLILVIIRHRRKYRGQTLFFHINFHNDLKISSILVLGMKLPIVLTQLTFTPYPIRRTESHDKTR